MAVQARKEKAQAVATSKAKTATAPKGRGSRGGRRGGRGTRGGATGGRGGQGGIRKREESCEEEGGSEDPLLYSSGHEELGSASKVDDGSGTEGESPLKNRKE
jgi:hypothetical protein